MRWMLAAVAAMGLAGGAMAQQVPPPAIGLAPMSLPPMGSEAIRIGEKLGVLHAAIRVCPHDEMVIAATVLAHALNNRLASTVPDQRWQDAAAGAAIRTESAHSRRVGPEHCTFLRGLVAQLAMERLAD